MQEKSIEFSLNTYESKLILLKPLRKLQER